MDPTSTIRLFVLGSLNLSTCGVPSSADMRIVVGTSSALLVVLLLGLVLGLAAGPHAAPRLLQDATGVAPSSTAAHAMAVLLIITHRTGAGPETDLLHVTDLSPGIIPPRELHL